MVCFIVTTAYRSSLISHLVVQDLSDAIDNMNDLVERGNSEGWTWGVRRMTGSLKPYLSSSLDPAILEVYHKMKVRGSCYFHQSTTTKINITRKEWHKSQTVQNKTFFSYKGQTSSLIYLKVSRWLYWYFMKLFFFWQTVGIEDGLKKVVRGGFSYIFNYYYIKPVIDTEYTDRRGYTPIYFSKTLYPLFSGNAWAFR